MGKAERHLSRRERQIMDVIYATGGATAAEVHERLPDAPSRTSVRTLLRILEEKGHLKHIQDGPRYVYRPVRSREHMGRSSLRRVLDTFFEGSLERAVAAHLADSAADLSPDELARLSQLINQARKKGK
jgi:predicted transcriptional regulator